MRDLVQRPGPSGETYLMAQFQEFYGELVRLKARIGRDDWLVLTGDEPPDVVAETSPNAVWQVLLSLLERQALESRRSGGDFAASIYAQAQYVMAALADEIFLHLDWPSREAWQSNLLEAKLFQSHTAGDVIFERLDELLARTDPVYLELAQIYLAALALGFQGKFRGQDNADLELAAYRRRLLAFITRQEATALEGRERFFSEAYAHTLDRGEGRELPYLRRWVTAFVVLVALWIFGSHLVWWKLTRDLRPLLERIVAATFEEGPQS